MDDVVVVSIASFLTTTSVVDGTDVWLINLVFDEERNDLPSIVRWIKVFDDLAVVVETDDLSELESPPPPRCWNNNNDDEDIVVANGRRIDE